MDVLGSQQSVCSDAATVQFREDEFGQQVDRWRALFTNMDVVLGNEATKLVRVSSLSKVITHSFSGLQRKLKLFH